MTKSPMIKISNIKLPVGHEQHALLLAIAKKLKTSQSQIASYQIMKRSLDARKKPQLYYVYQVVVECRNDATKLLKASNKRIDNKQKDIEIYHQPISEPLKLGEITLKHRPVIIGAGPAGLMAALLLAEHGFRPVVFERGQDVDKRAKDIDEFWKTGKLNLESNVQLGEGGAGTFSDGKLTTRIRDTLIDKVYQYFVEAGAPEEILYINKPHIGTDILRMVVKNLREKLIQLGGEIYFGHKVADIDIVDGQVQAVVVESDRINTNNIIFAIGHSARDTYEMLYKRNVAMDPKSLAIGVRIEHPQSLINHSQYGEYHNYEQLGAAEYQLVRKKDQHIDRSVYTFCMCPGGVVVAAASEAYGVVTNGMSYHGRDLANANSAMVVNIDPVDYGYVNGKSPLLGIEYLRKWERKAYELGGNNYHAPAQLVKDFLQDRPSVEIANNLVTPTYLPGVTPADLRKCLPAFVADALKQAIIDFGKRIDGFDLGEAILTGVETRTSSPVRIQRQQNGESVNVKGLYPTGEGAGYAGGIVSAAVDGLKAAQSIIQTYRPL